jgi:hypothetical protein
MYYLHGLNGEIDQNQLHFESQMAIKVASGEWQPFIIIKPDGNVDGYPSGGDDGPRASTAGSRWADSGLFGHFSRYVSEDVVNWTDTYFRTVALPHARAGWFNHTRSLARFCQSSLHLLPNTHSSVFFFRSILILPIVTGWSMGGDGAWQAFLKSETFGAAVPVSARFAFEQSVAG